MADTTNSIEITGTSSSTRVEEGIKQIQEMHRLGEGPHNNFAASPPVAGRTELTAKRYSEKYRSFADSYSQSELQELIAEARKHNFVLTISLMIRLISVKDIEERKRIQTLMMEQPHWSVRDLNKYLARTRGVRAYGGRPKTIKSFEDGALRVNQALQEATDILRRTLPLIGPTDHNSETKKGVEKLFADVCGHIGRIADTAKFQLQLPALRNKRKTTIPLSRKQCDRLIKISEIAASGSK